MLTHWPKVKHLVLIAVGYLCLHALCVLIAMPRPLAASYPFMVTAPCLALAACCWRVRGHPAPIRLPWILICIGLLLWISGITLSAWEDLAEHLSPTVAYFSDLIFFLYGAPILLAISAPTESERIPGFLWLDSLQAVITAYLVYVTLFVTLPFTHQALQSIPVSRLSLTYNIENLALACGATLRLLAHPRKVEDRRFYQALSSFLWSYFACAGIYNSKVLPLQEQTGLYDLLVDAPFLLLAVLSLRPSNQESEAPAGFDSKPLALFIDNASPVLYTLALLALGFANLRLHFYLGVISVVIALIVYAIRSSTLQSRYMQSQRALRDAHDRLEAMSLQDGLTGVANRRCFDQRLDLEWNRALRMQHPLSLLLIDIDYFKNLNDRFGHRTGDQCLIDLAQVLRAALPRKGDLLARYGGEEFAAILVGADRAGAELVAERMREAICARNIQNETPIGPFVTGSIGIATCIFPQSGSPSALIESADRGLYQAKKEGRNRISYFPMQSILDAPLSNP